MLTRRGEFGLLSLGFTGVNEAAARSALSAGEAQPKGYMVALTDPEKAVLRAFLKVKRPLQPFAQKVWNSRAV